MKKLTSFCLIVLMSSIILAGSTLALSKEEKAKKELKAFIGEPIYCKITLEDLKAAREAAKLEKQSLLEDQHLAKK